MVLLVIRLRMDSVVSYLPTYETLQCRDQIARVNRSIWCHTVGLRSA